MRFTRLLLTTLFLLSGATFINAQENKCALKNNQAPELRGFRLGMTTEQVKARVPLVSLQPPDEFGLSKAYVSGSELKEGSKADFSGVTGIGFEFLDGRVTQIAVGYVYIKWKSVDRFITKINESLALPNAWQGGGGITKTLECDQFQMQAVVQGNSDPHLIIRDLRGPQIVERRREEKEEKQRQSFRP